MSTSVIMFGNRDLVP